MGKHIKTDCHEMGEDDHFSHCIAVMLYWAIKGGVRSDGDTVTMIVPSINIGTSRETAFESGEFEIKITKIGD